MEVHAEQSQIDPNTESKTEPNQVKVIQQQSTGNPKNKVSLLSIVLIIFFLVAIGVAGYFGYENFILKNTKIVTTPPPEQPIRPTDIPDTTINWKTYQDSEESFSIKYPNGWKISKQGDATKPWIDISSPDKAPIGSQQPLIGMTVGIQVFNNFQVITNNDLKKLVSTEGILKHYKVNTISENFEIVGGNQAFKYEYEGNESMYSFHFWGMNIAKNNSIISINITDFKVDTDLNSSVLAPQILSTFKFIDQTIDTTNGYITGKITINYINIPEFPDVKDDIVVSISKVKKNEVYFGASLCEKEANNCVWLLTQNGKTRTFGYRIDHDGDADQLSALNKYIIEPWSRLYNQTGNLGDARKQITVEIPKSGVLVQDISVTAQHITD